MKACTFFKTGRGNLYAYDINNSYLLTVHPIMEDIHNNIESGGDDLWINGLSDKYPELSDSDIQFYLKKYKFLKTNSFFGRTDIDELLSGQVTPRSIESQLNNLDIITFQVTGQCNLNCTYCCFGELYDTKEAATPIPMDFSTVEKVFDYMKGYWAPADTHIPERTVAIGFYGGEPLLNFSLIEEVVAYCKELGPSIKTHFIFNITTNAMLLEKHAEYLVKNDFHILFSLDGDEKSNRLRVDKNQRPSYQRVFNNIKKLQRDYSEFFSRNVEFNSVLNSGSSAKEVNEFILKEFGKIPTVSPVSDVGLAREKWEAYMQIMQPYVETPELVEMRRDKSARMRGLGALFYYGLNNSYKYFADILIEKRMQKKIPTGTCLPFFKKMYVTSDRKIYACERIGAQYVLGCVDERVDIDFNKVSELYNSYFKEIKKQCVDCYLADSCSLCVFQFPTENDLPKCREKYGKEEYQHHLGRMIGLLEEQPHLFGQVNKFVFG